jgi:Zn-dependent peptidase ImmA (M78 family)
MLELTTSYTLSKIPYITNDALDQYAEDVIRDAMPENLAEPTILDVESFVEFYLDMQIEFKRICGDRKIMAMTAFNTGIVQIYDDAGKTPLPLVVQEGTLIVDPILMIKRNLARRRFTFMHEASHWLIHRQAFSEDNPFGTPGVYENQYLAAKEGRIDYSRSLKNRTDNDRIERQADFLSSAMLMPKSTLRMAFKDFFMHCADREKPRAIVRGKNEKDDYLAKLLPEYIAERFGVSKRASLIRLEKLGAIADSHPWGCYETY